MSLFALTLPLQREYRTVHSSYKLRSSRDEISPQSKNVKTYFFADQSKVIFHSSTRS